MPLIGFTFWQTWQMLVMQAGVLVPISYPSLNTSAHITWIFIITTLLFPVFAYLKYKLQKDTAISTYLVSGLAGVSGTLIIALSPIMPDWSITLLICGTVLYSLGNTLLLLLWGSYWSTLETGRVIISLSSSYALSFALFILIRVVPRPFIALVTALLFALSAMAVKLGEKDEKRRAIIAPFSYQKAPYPRMLVFVLFVSATFGFAVSCFSMNSSGDFHMIESVGTAILLIAFIALILYLCVTESMTSGPTVLYRMIIPAVVAGMMLLLLLPTGFLSISFGSIMFGIYCLDVLMFVVASDLAFRHNRPIELVFGATFFTARFGTLSAHLISLVMISNGVLSSDNVLPIVLGLIYILLIIGTMVFTKSDLSALYRIENKKVEFWNNESNAQPLEERCARIASDFRLSSRESEVFLLLAKGRSIPYICDSLNIALNTGKRHVSNIYRKLGVYERQGLLDLVEFYDSKADL